jgi:hypothetical protein
MRPMHIPMLLIAMVFGLAVGHVGCSKSEAPSAASQPAQQGNTDLASTMTQPSQQQATTSSADSGKGKIDACALLTSKEIQSIQGEPLKDVKPSGRSEGGFSVSQCFFALPTLTNSISLVVTQRGDGPGAREPKQFWKETFHRDSDSEKARDKGREEEEKESAPPQKISGVGDEAFWSASRVGGALYVLKGNAFIRVSVGGASDQQAKTNKSKALAQAILKHL